MRLDDRIVIMMIMLMMLMINKKKKKKVMMTLMVIVVMMMMMMMMLSAVDQLSRIIQETSDFGPYLPVSRLEYEISRIFSEVCSLVVDSTFRQ